MYALLQAWPFAVSALKRIEWQSEKREVDARGAMSERLGTLRKIKPAPVQREKVVPTAFLPQHPMARLTPARRLAAGLITDETARTDLINQITAMIGYSNTCAECRNKSVPNYASQPRAWRAVGGRTDRPIDRSPSQTSRCSFWICSSRAVTAGSCPSPGGE